MKIFAFILLSLYFSFKLSMSIRGLSQADKPETIKMINNLGLKNPKKQFIGGIIEHFILLLLVNILFWI